MMVEVEFVRRVACIYASASRGPTVGSQAFNDASALKGGLAPYPGISTVIASKPARRRAPCRAIAAGWCAAPGLLPCKKIAVPTDLSPGTVKSHAAAPDGSRTRSAGNDHARA